MEMTTKEANSLTGGLSYTSKMPCPSWGISALKCKTGNKLAEVPGSVCSDCYARKFRYLFKNVIGTHSRRLELFGGPKWVDAMTHLIYPHPLFRWFDSGDLQDVDMLDKIIKVVRNTDLTTHWMPSREHGIVGSWVRRFGKLPHNLVLRLSAYMIDGKPPTRLAKSLGCLTSTVSVDDWTCPAHLTNNSCGKCRCCWRKDVPNVAYKLH